MQGKKNLRSKICSAALKFPIAACPQALCASLLSRSAPSVTAAKPLRLRAPFSGPPGRKAVHSASCLSRLLPGAPRFSGVTLALGALFAPASLRLGRNPARFAVLGFRPRSGPSGAARLRSRFSGVTLRSGQVARSLSLRLGQNTDLLRKSWFFALASLQAPSLPASPRFSPVTLRLFATRGFPPTQAKPGPTSLALGFCFRCAPSALLTMAPRFSFMIIRPLLYLKRPVNLLQ